MECVCLKTRSQDFNDRLRHTMAFKELINGDQSNIAHSTCSFKHLQLRNLTIVSYNRDITT